MGRGGGFENLLEMEPIQFVKLRKAAVRGLVGRQGIAS